MAISALRIGIEIEVLLCAKRMQDQCKPSSEEFAESLVQYYNIKSRDRAGRAEMRLALDMWHAGDDPTNFRYWCILEEASINPNEDRYKHLKLPSMRPCEGSRLPRPPVLIRIAQGPFEFASPIMRYEFGSLWRSNLRSHFQIIESYAEIMSDVTCGTHVHVSPGGSKWTLDQVKNVSRSILYFEEAFEVLLPPERRGNRECRSNRIDNPELRCLPHLETCCQRIQECTTIKALTQLMNAKEKDSFIIYEDSDGEPSVTERRYGFNFENLLEGKIGTIEFRRPPCVTNYEDCVMWSEFGASFLQAAMQYGITLDHLRTYGPDVAGLAAFVEMAAIPGMNDQEILEKIFARGSGSLPVVSLKDNYYYQV